MKTLLTLTVLCLSLAVSAKDIPQIKKRLHPERAAELARIAEEALKTYVQVKK